MIIFEVELITGLIQPNFKLGIFSLKGKNKTTINHQILVNLVKVFGEVIPDIKIHAICMCVYLNIFIFWGDNHMIYICIKSLKIQIFQTVRKNYSV